MKRLILVLLLIVLLSGCHSQKFTYDNSQIELDTELSSVLELMMDKGNYSDNLTVQYNKAMIAIDFSQGYLVLETAQFSVLRDFNGEEYEYDLTACFDNEGILKCKEERGLITGGNVEEEILLTRAFDIFSNIDVRSITSELRNEYKFTDKENMLLQAHFVLPTDIQDDIERFENIVFYYNGEYHYNSIFEPNEMMLQIRVDVFGNGEGDTYIVYLELD